MKKLLLVTAGFLTCVSSFAQNSKATRINAEIPAAGFSLIQTQFAKGTGNGDTFLVRNFTTPADTLTLYYVDSSPFDSGLSSGTNGFGYKGFAERFTIKGTDSAVSILGAAVYFYGTASANSTKSVNIRAWSQGPKVSAGITGRPHLFFNGKPNTVLNTLTVPLTQLRKSNGRIDSFRLFQFATPTAYINDSFFVGFDINYTWATLAGDTVNVVQTTDGHRHSPTYLVSGADTLLNVQNATQASNGNWLDNYYEAEPGLYNNYAMYAYFKVRIPNGVNGITKNDLTVFGTFPNPGNNNVTAKFSLAKAADATIDIMDINGRVLQSTTVKGAAAGEHFVPLSTSSLPSGNYICLIRTSNGDGMGVQMTVAH